MKTLKITLKAMAIILMATFVSCKKSKNDGGEPNSKNQELATADLVKNYIVAERKTGDRKLVVLYFWGGSGGAKGLYTP